MEVFDKAPPKFPDSLRDYFNEVLDKPGDMAKKCVSEYGAELISVRLEGTHPEKGNKSAEEAAEIVKQVLGSVSADGSLSYTIANIDTAQANRLAIIIARVDAQESADPFGQYTIGLQPGAGGDAPNEPS